MMEPNWFDYRYEEALKSATAEESLALLAKDKYVLAAVREALQNYDENAGKSGWGGPTRTQAVRSAVFAVLTAKQGDPAFPG